MIYIYIVDECYMRHFLDMYISVTFQNWSMTTSSECFKCFTSIRLHKMAFSKLTKRLSGLMIYL